MFSSEIYNSICSYARSRLTLILLSFSARMYKSDPDLRIKGEAFEPSSHSSFSEVSNWLQCSMQLGETRHHTHARDPFLCARDPYAFQEQMDNLEWRPPVLQAMALIKQEPPSELDEMLINQAQNVCQMGSRREATESQCKVFMPSFWDAHVVNDCEPWYDLDVAPFPRGEILLQRTEKRFFKNDNAEAFFRGVISRRMTATWRWSETLTAPPVSQAWTVRLTSRGATRRSPFEACWSKCFQRTRNQEVCHAKAQNSLQKVRPSPPMPIPSRAAGATREVLLHDRVGWQRERSVQVYQLGRSSAHVGTPAKQAFDEVRELCAFVANVHCQGHPNKASEQTRLPIR